MSEAGTKAPAPATLTDSRLAALCAQTTRQAHQEYEERFHQITRRARARFLAREWPESYSDASERLHLYSTALDGLTARIKELLGDRLADHPLWSAIKAVYSSLIVESAEWEIAESFFNSLTRRVFATRGVDQTIEFVDTDFDAPPTGPEETLHLRLSGAALPDLLFTALTEPSAGGFAEECWENLRAACEVAAERITAAGSAEKTITAPGLEMIGSAFYRGRGAYLVGRLLAGAEEGHSLPLALSLRHESERGITLDAVLLGEVDLSILFSYTRAYFRVEGARPYDLVHSLRRLMPRKRWVDLYNSIGYPRHGKTELYRDFVAHLRKSDDCFIAAEGTRGMVMLVFTLPSYDLVFKLIRDTFDFPKDSTRAEVMGRYRLVFEHDRAGRLVEAHEFEHLRIARDRFERSLLDDLLRHAAEIVRIDGDDVVITHAYVERRIRPLNLFFLEAGVEEVQAAARDYGQAMKDLAVSNIFPGDLLTKNFGVTRSGRVVFYDYDELCFVTDCNFRDLPQATTHEQEMAAEPWYSVRPNDIFPEEFPSFLSLPAAGREALLAEHADLFQAEFWRGVQKRLRGGEVPEVFPYARERKLHAARTAERGES